MQAPQLGERVDQFFGHAVAEVFLIAIGTVIRERQHGDGI